MPVHCMNRKNTRIVSILLTMIYFRMKKVDLSDDRIADLYYLKAESCFELEDYGGARVKAFKKVFQHGGQKVSFTVITPLHLLIMMNWIRKRGVGSCRRLSNSR